MPSKYKCKSCKDTGLLTTYQRLLPFNPNSSDQVKALFRSLNLAIPKKRGEDRETTEQKYLKRLKKRFPVFGGILDVRKRNKLISDYMWSPGADGTIRTTYGLHPSTLRKSSRGPNLQVIPRPDNPLCSLCYQEAEKGPSGWWCPNCNLPAAEGLASLVRETICAPPGYVLMEADSEGIEAVLVAKDVGSERMLKVAKAGIHGYFLSGVRHEQIDWQLPFDQLKAACKKEKKADGLMYDKCKRVVHGTNYCLTPYGMADEYEEVFMPAPGDKEKTAKAVAERYQKAYFALFPELLEWQHRIQQQAHTQRYLENRFGYRHYFYDVFSWNRTRNCYELGTDGKRCVAFKPQSEGSACQTEYTLAIDDHTVAEPGDTVWQLLNDTLCLLIHDSLVFCIPESTVKPAAQAVADVMNMPLAELGGLRIGVEVKAGQNMKEQSVVEVNQVI